MTAGKICDNNIFQYLHILCQPVCVCHNFIIIWNVIIVTLIVIIIVMIVTITIMLVMLVMIICQEVLYSGRWAGQKRDSDQGRPGADDDDNDDDDVDDVDDNDDDDDNDDIVGDADDVGLARCR